MWNVCNQRCLWIVQHLNGFKPHFRPNIIYGGKFEGPASHANHSIDACCVWLDLGEFSCCSNRLKKTLILAILSARFGWTLEKRSLELLFLRFWTEFSVPRWLIYSAIVYGRHDSERKTSGCRPRCNHHRCLSFRYTFRGGLYSIQLVWPARVVIYHIGSISMLTFDTYEWLKHP